MKIKKSKNLFISSAFLLFLLLMLVFSYLQSINNSHQITEGKPISFLIQKGNIASKIFKLPESVVSGMLRERCHNLKALTNIVENKLQCHKINNIKNNTLKSSRTIILSDANDDHNVGNIDYNFTDYTEIVAVFDTAHYQGKTSVVARLYGLKNFIAYEIVNKIHLDSLQGFLDALPEDEESFIEYNSLSSTEAKKLDSGGIPVFY